VYVCLCTGVTTKDVEAAIGQGARSTKDVAALCQAGSVCGRCRHTVRQMLAAADPNSVRSTERMNRRWGRDG
jgi:bacterioferritin-associated ferredoxin